MTVFALIVAIYASIPSLDHPPHTFALFYTKETCETAAKHFEEMGSPYNHDGAVALCVERQQDIPLS